MESERACKSHNCKMRVHMWQKAQEGMAANVPAASPAWTGLKLPQPARLPQSVSALHDCKLDVQHRDWLKLLVAGSPASSQTPQKWWHTAHCPSVFLWSWLTHLIPDSQNWWHTAHWMLQTDCCCQASAKKDGGKRASEIGCRISLLPARLPQSIPKIHTHM
jgi:hypothetical protein